MSSFTYSVIAISFIYFIQIIVLTVLFVAGTFAAPQVPRGGISSDPAQAEIIRYENDNIGIDGYSFA